MTRDLQPGDRALERVITEIRTAASFTHDPRLVELLRHAEAMRTSGPSEAERVQQEQARAVKWRTGQRGGRW